MWMSMPRLGKKLLFLGNACGHTKGSWGIPSCLQRSKRVRTRKQIKYNVSNYGFWMNVGVLGPILDPNVSVNLKLFQKVKKRSEKF